MSELISYPLKIIEPLEAILGFILTSETFNSLVKSFQVIFLLEGPSLNSLSSYPISLANCSLIISYWISSGIFSSSEEDLSSWIGLTN